MDSLGLENSIARARALADLAQVATVRRPEPMDDAYLLDLEGTLNEWTGIADEQAFRDL